MNRLALAALALASVASMAGPLAPVARSATAPTLVTLKNGLRVVLAPDSSAAAVDVCVSYAAGARTLPASEEGVRHLAERMLFLGGADGARVRALTAEGGSAGSATTADAVVFWETMPAEAVALTLRTEAARMTPGRATSETFDAARRSALAEAHARSQLAPLPAALTRLAGSVFEGEPYARPVVSPEAAITPVTQEAVETWRARHLVPANAVLVVTGRFEPEPLLAAVRAAFEPLPRGAAASRAAAPTPRAGARRLREVTKTPAPMLIVGWRVPGAADPDAPAIDLIAAVLGGGENSRLNRALAVEGHAATGGQCGVDRRRDGSMFWAAAVAATPGDTAEAERVLLDVLGGPARDRLSDADFDRARAQLVTGELFRAQDLHARSLALADAVLSGGDLAAADSRFATLARLTPDDLLRVARRVLDENARTVLWLIPGGGAR